MKQKRQVKRPRPKGRTPARIGRRPIPKKTATPPSLSLANIISGFYSFRSSVQDLSASLQRIENILDSCYRILEIAQTFMDRKPAPPTRSPLRLLPPLKRFDENEHPSFPSFQAPEPFDEEMPSQGPSMGNLDIQKIITLLQSPMVQNLLAGFLQGSNRSGHKRTG